MAKLESAVQKTGITTVAIAGGVSANSLLRQSLALKHDSAGWDVFIPPMSLCTDNAAMVGISGYYKFIKGLFCGLEVTPQPRMAF